MAKKGTGRSQKTPLLIATIVASSSLIGVVSISLLWKWYRRRRSIDGDDDDDNDKSEALQMRQHSSKPQKKNAKKSREYDEIDEEYDRGKIAKHLRRREQKMPARPAPAWCWPPPVICVWPPIRQNFPSPRWIWVSPWPGVVYPGWFVK